MMLWLSHDIKWLVHYDEGQKRHCNKTQVIRISRTNKRQDRNMLKRYIVQIIIALSALIALPSLAAEEGQDKLAYFTLEPDLTTNFYTKGKQLGYIQVRIDIMVAREADLPLIERHQPLIRDAVVEMLGKQSEDTIKSLAGREDLRKNLVQYLNSILLPETGKTVIADLLFTKYLYQ
ncbi:flagellar FliL protein [Vibrio xiamenensis]|uniref:Flagellar protein FliL n=2 Tax=Vibrio xiamenensis TaxID=861298 RepID=A0A1G8G3P6_9VIBR|nr:flagellar FliL protein [Vibrio xiamenensis]